MSSVDHYKRWLKIKQQMNDVLLEDARIQRFATGFVGIKPQSTAVEIVARVYAKYCQIYNNICEIYDQMIQPQRGEYIKTVIDAITCRLLELKATLEDIEALEYTYPDNALQQLIMVPQDIEILCPYFYPFEIRQKELQYIVDNIFDGKRLGDPEPTPSEIERQEQERLEEERIKQEEKDAEIKRKLAMGEDIEPSIATLVYTPDELAEMTRKEAYDRHLANIQRMERGRRVTAEINKNIWQRQNLYLELAGLKKPQASDEVRNRASQYIKKMLVAYMKLKREHEKVDKLKKKLDMIITSWSPPSQKIRLEQVKEARRKYRREYFKKWGEKHLKEKAHVFRLREGDIMEDISSEVRQWFRKFYDEVRVFDEYPWPEEGGSILVVQGDTFTIEEYLEWEAAEKRRIKLLEGKTPEDIKAEKQAEKEERQRKAAEQKERDRKTQIEHNKARQKPDKDPGIWLMIGKYSEAVQKAWLAYENTWKRFDTVDASPEAIKGILMELITENVYQEVNKQLRPIVDEMMRIELGLLRAELKYDNDLAKEKMPLIRKRKKPRKAKVVKPEKTPPEVLFQRAVDSGIVVKYPRTTLDEFWGDRNYAAADLRAIPYTPAFPPPTIGDVKEQIRAKTVLTLGSSCKNAVRSQLLVGPKGSGKRSLVYAVATETNSILIDLSPMNVYNKFPGKRLKELFTLVNKVSRIMQPTIIYVRDADKMFYKKVPKEEKEVDPTRLSKDFFKEIVKGIKGDDKILILGTASEPWVARNAQLSKSFKGTILMPRSDYASISFILTKIVMKYHGVNREFDVHSLAQALRGYNINAIKNAVEKVLRAERVAKLAYKPLHPIEIVNVIMEDEEAVLTSDLDYELYNQWYLSYSPWGKKYIDLMLIIQKQLEFKLKAEKK